MPKYAQSTPGRRQAIGATFIEPDHAKLHAQAAKKGISASRLLDDMIVRALAGLRRETLRNSRRKTHVSIQVTRETNETLDSVKSLLGMTKAALIRKIWETST